MNLIGMPGRNTNYIAADEQPRKGLSIGRAQPASTFAIPTANGNVPAMDILKGASYHRDPIEAVIYRVLVIVMCCSVTCPLGATTPRAMLREKRPGHSRK